MIKKSKYSSSAYIRKSPPKEFNVTSRNAFVNIENILKSDVPLEAAADRILDTVLMDNDIITRKDVLDRFLDYLHFKAKTGYDHILNLAYPSKRIEDPVIESKAIELINVHLVPNIIYSLLKYFTRNIQSSDTNLYIAWLLEKDEVIRPIYETFLLFKKDIFHPDKDSRSKNVRRLQQHLDTADARGSSPLDAACRLKYILEYIMLKQDVSHIYTKEDLNMAPQPRAVHE
jgi:hypothetical protein